ncbi:ribonuclease HIII [candidate division KSB1 bacterium]|nr:ribonuclease HIII [candidate division KSB1 bacterium]
MVAALERVVAGLSDHLAEEGWSVLHSKEIAYGVQLRLDCGGMQALLRLYHNKKGEVRPDFSQIADRRVATRLAEWLGRDARPAPGAVLRVDGDLVGADESGKGDFFGPLVCAAVYVDSRSRDRLLALGIRDSKAVADRPVLRLSREIIDCCPDAYALVELTPVVYNRRYAEVGNLNLLLADCHARAIGEVVAKVRAEQVVVDQFGPAALLEKELKSLEAKIRLIQAPRAESVLAVAAASILARARYLERLMELEQRFQVELPKGASNAVLQAARRFVECYGRDRLAEVAKLHFKTTGRIGKQ